MGGPLSIRPVFAALLIAFSAGCVGQLLPPQGLPPQGPPPWAAGGVAPQNPIYLPVTDRELLWNQMVDALDDYFRIAREERVHVVGEVLTEGRIETFPTVGSSWFEPWRSDSSPGFEKAQSTFQSIRRQATLRTTPTQGGYLVEVIVQKELEDVSQPEFTSGGTYMTRYDSSLQRKGGPIVPGADTLGWLPIGRDITLEQRILADIRSRMGIGPGQAPYAGP